MNLSDILRNHAKRRPEHPAIVSRDRQISYSEFDRGVDTTARFLVEAGIRQGDIVGVALKDTPEHMAVLFGIARIGAIILPVDRRWTAGEKERTIEHFQASLILIDEGDSVPQGNVPARRLDISLFDGPSVDKGRVVGAVGDNLPLVLSLSSGTTGRPKGPLLTHENFFARFLIYYVSLTLNEHDRFACSSPLYFSGSRGFSMCIIYAGATLVLLPPPVSPAVLIGEINDHRCTSAFIVPTMLRRLMSERDEDTPCFPDMRVLISTGSALFAEDREKALKKVSANILNFYGSAEGGGVSVLGPNHAAEERTSAGAIVFGSNVRIVDDNYEEVPRGVIGQISYKSGGTATSFFNDPEASKAAFRDGWYFPGDLGYVSERGFVFITGREKDLIIRAGVNIYPNEIESALLAHPDVSEAAVVGMPSEELGEEILAFVVSDREFSEGELREHCAKHLASYKIPKLFCFITDVPRTSVGKIDKKRLSASRPMLSGV
jgi:long-chain acyl-CoA synthetase